MNNNKLLTHILYLVLFSLISSFIFIYYFEKKLGPQLIICAEKEVKQITTIVTNKSLRKYISNNKNNHNCLNIEKNNNGEIILINYNTKYINETITKITKIVEKDLQNLTKNNQDGLILAIPIGNATGNSLLANIGPKIPIKLKLIGTTETNIKSKVTEYGLNNAMVEIYLEVKSTTLIQMPFISKEIIIKNKIPLTTEIIQGNIPEYYLKNK